MTASHGQVNLTDLRERAERAIARGKAGAELALPDVDEKWSIVVYLSRLDQAAIFSMLSCTPSLNTTPSMT